MAGLAPSNSGLYSEAMNSLWQLLTEGRNSTEVQFIASMCVDILNMLQWVSKYYSSGWKSGSLVWHLCSPCCYAWAYSVLFYTAGTLYPQTLGAFFWQGPFKLSDCCIERFKHRVGDFDYSDFLVRPFLHADVCSCFTEKVF